MARRGAKMRPIKDIITTVTVKPHAMMGRNSAHSATVPLHTGYASTPFQRTRPATTSSTHINIWTIVSGIGAIASLIMAGLLFWSERRRAAMRKQPPT
jgi:hypothetical protein